jgi:hypothetical protein
MLRRDAPDLVYVDAREVRGKQAKANLWTLDGRATGQMTGLRPTPAKPR